MSDQLIPPPELAPTVPPGLKPEEYIAIWFDWMDLFEQLLLAGLRMKIGPDGDLQAAYRQWCEAQMEEHDRAMQHMVERFDAAFSRMDKERNS